MTTNKLKIERNWQTPRVETLLRGGYTEYQIQHLARKLEREGNTFVDILGCKSIKTAVKKLNKLMNKSIELPTYY